MDDTNTHSELMQSTQFAYMQFLLPVEIGVILTTMLMILLNTKLKASVARQTCSIKEIDPKRN